MVINTRFVPITSHLFPGEASPNSIYLKSFRTAWFTFWCSVIHEHPLCARLGNPIDKVLALEEFRS